MPTDPYGVAVLADAPLAYYRLNEATSATTAVDSSGNLRDGTITGTLTSVAGMLPSTTDTALSSAGSSAVVVPYAAWQSTSSFTVEGWAKLPSVAGVQTFIGRYDGFVGSTFAQSSFVLRTSAGGGLVGYLMGPGNTLQGGTIGTVLTANTRYYVAMTYDGTTAKIYLNGVQDTTWTATGMNAGVLGLSIFRAQALEAMTGTMDEVAYYGTALSATRILAHYNAGLLASGYPATLAGNRLWVRAKDLGTGSVSVWPNVAAATNDGISAGTAPTVATASTPGGGKSVRFGGAGNFTFKNIGSRGYTSASSIFAAGYEASNAIDTGTAPTWATATLPAWWQIELPDAETVTTYRLMPYNNQQPTAWTLSGSNDGTVWTTLDTRTGQSLATNVFSSPYTFSNSTAYKVYRFNFTAGTGGIVNMGEIEIGGVANSATTTMEAWIVVKSDGNATYQGLWHMGGDAGTATYYPYAGGSLIYEGFANSDALNTTWTHSMAITSWRLYRVKNDGTVWQAWLDNTSQFTRASQPATWGQVPLLGKNRTAWFMNGNVAEVLIRSQVSTTAEAAALTAYFNAEHGLTVTVPVTNVEGHGPLPV